MRTTLRIYLIVIVSALLACNKKQVLNREDFEKWLKSHKEELTKVRIINRLKYKVTYHPVQWLLIKSQKQTAMNGDVTSVKKDYQDILSFTLDITDTSENYSMLRYELRSEGEYYDRMNYYSNLIQQDIYLVDGKDTLLCAFSHMEQTYNISPVNTITLEFQRKASNKEFNETWLIYNDRIFNSGILKFHFKKEDLNSIPELKI